MSEPQLVLAESVATTGASYFIFVYIAVLIYCCFGLAVVCDVYFVPALQKLSTRYNLPPDIAGSTLMALGASVPELFASLIGVFVTEDDIGTGSIIGSSCFNLIAVPAACAFVASSAFTHQLSISSKPVIRNSAFYAITILVLLLIIKDNQVDIPEAIILLLFFVMYMTYMIFSAHSSKNYYDSIQNSLSSSYISTDSAIECNVGEKKGKFGNINNNQRYYNQQQACYGQFHFDTSVPQQQNIIKKHNYVTETTPLVSGLNKSIQIAIPPIEHKNSFNQQYSGSVSMSLGVAIKNSTCIMKSVGNDDHFGGRNDYEKIDKSSNEHDDAWVSSKFILIPLLPLTLSMKILTPLKFKNTCWTIWTFLVSIALIGGLTYVSVWMVHLFGQSIGIPETISGMTILSWGTGIPELIASIVLIKKTGQADMAICNTIGSNVIDVSFCLSLPWIVKCLIFKTQGIKPLVGIQSESLPWTTFILLVSLALLILVLKLHNWTLSFSVGVWLSVIYITFVAVATYLEYNYSESGLSLL